MKLSVTGMCVVVTDLIYLILEQCHHSLVRIISAKQEIVILFGTISTVLILFGMARVVALKAPDAVSIILLGSANNYHSQLLMILS